MTRPLYETDQDRQNEAEVAKFIASAWLCDVFKMKPACVVDYAIMRSGRIAAVMEIKCRNYDYERLEGLGGLILSAHKLQSGKAWRDAHKISFVLAVQLTDGLFVMSIKPDEEWPHFSLTLAGRRDRGDKQDIEPCALIPMERFVRYA